MKREYLRLLPLGLVSTLALGAVVPLAQAETEGESSQYDASLEEITVYGIRKALRDSVEKKRDATAIVDVISAEDIGKLPDENAARALQRVTGVQISTRDGEGSEIQVRGMSQVNMEMNGVAYLGTPSQPGFRSSVRRNATLEDIPAELLSSLEVIKSPSADRIEGAIGATVDMKTRKPLDSDGLQLAASSKASYSELTEEPTERYSFLIGNNWDDKFGVLLNVTQGESVSRNDSIDYRNWDGLSFEDWNSNAGSLQAWNENVWWDAEQDPASVCAPYCWRNMGWADDGSGNNVATENGGWMPTLMHYDAETGNLSQVIAPQEIELQQKTIYRDRLGVNLALQYNPSENISLYADVIASDYEEEQQASILTYAIRDIDWPNTGVILDESIMPFTLGQYTATGDAPSVAGIELGSLNAVDGEVTLLSGGFTPISWNNNGNSQRMGGQSAHRDVQNRNFSFGGSWWNDDWTVAANVSGGKSKFDSIWLRQDLKGSYGNVNCGWRDPRPVDPNTGLEVPCAENVRWGYDLSGGGAGSLTLDPTLSAANPNDPNADYLTDPYSYAVAFVSLWKDEFTSDYGAVALDFDYNLDSNLGMLNFGQLEFGVRVASRGNERKVQQGMGTHWQEECTDETCSVVTDQRLGVEDANSVYIQPHQIKNAVSVNDGSFLEKVGGNIPRQWISGNPSVYGNPLQDLADIWGMYPVSDKINDYTVDEDTQAVYAKVNFESDSGVVSGNIGVRVVGTETASTNYSVREGVSSEYLFVPIYNEEDYVANTLKRDYSDVLPSATVNWDITDDLKWRTAASKVMARPDLTDLTSGIFITSITSRQGIIGNPDLDPYRANQFDTSLEWYFSEGSMLSGALFYKDINSFITHDYSVTFMGPGRTPNEEGVIEEVQYNGRMAVNESGEVRGAEFSYQQMFSGPLDGFGTLLNYTFVDSETPDGMPVPQLSEHSANAILFFEKAGFGARLAYNWRDDALLAARGSGGRSEYSKDYGQLDFSLGYEINDNFKVTLEGLNLTEENLESYVDIEERVLQFQQLDRVFQLGIIGRF
ncbi:TonB-dependent receptor [Microbulbifer harenosus]|uniref:TonB-dependent receptor n=1 Tax=Microbulbifer harenosus TaxID=2576840 RepID=A0ABY2UI47_9GAMM|nr:TonB-dependent receptor [Microbulbifer harenosus]TLM75255.1 TonB-dependent receptor [Microbulbifer harenosus]